MEKLTELGLLSLEKTEEGSYSKYRAGLEDSGSPLTQLPPARQPRTARTATETALASRLPARAVALMTSRRRRPMGARGGGGRWRLNSAAGLGGGWLGCGAEVSGRPSGMAGRARGLTVRLCP